MIPSLLFLAKGMAIGLAVAAPIGPTAIFCLNIALQHGFTKSFLAGVGASLAIALFAGVAGFGLSSIATYLVSHKVWMRAVGGSFLMLIALQLLFAKSQVEQASTVNPKSHWRAFITTFLLTITNPMMIILFLASFSSLGLLGSHNPRIAAVAVTSGVGIGAFLWWTLFTGAVSATRQKLPAWVVQWSNRASALVLAGFSLVSLARLV